MEQLFSYNSVFLIFTQYYSIHFTKINQNFQPPNLVNCPTITYVAAKQGKRWTRGAQKEKDNENRILYWLKQCKVCIWRIQHRVLLGHQHPILYMTQFCEVLFDEHTKSIQMLYTNLGKSGKRESRCSRQKLQDAQEK